MVVSNICYFHRYFGKISDLTRFFNWVVQPPTNQNPISIDENQNRKKKTEEQGHLQQILVNQGKTVGKVHQMGTDNPVIAG